MQVLGKRASNIFFVWYQHIRNALISICRKFHIVYARFVRIFCRKLWISNQMVAGSKKFCRGLVPVVKDASLRLRLLSIRYEVVYKTAGHWLWNKILQCVIYEKSSILSNFVSFSLICILLSNWCMVDRIWLRFGFVFEKVRRLFI